MVDPPDVGRAEDWSVDEQMLYELAWYEVKLRESGYRKEANLCKKLRATLEAL